ncbi:MAG: hypothetical protein U5L00_18215 [Desulfovermiculus sp.]|nr:hypothetical protein [Desulfovermiculus sp.]
MSKKLLNYTFHSRSNWAPATRGALKSYSSCIQAGWNAHAENVWSNQKWFPDPELPYANRQVQKLGMAGLLGSALYCQGH